MKIGKVVFRFLFFVFFVWNWEGVALWRHNGRSRGSLSQEIKTIVIFFLSV